MKTNEDTIILAFDTSCDETSVAVVKNGRKTLSNIISSQIKTHAEYGGVVPELASRAHIDNIDFVTERALKEAGVTLYDIDCVAATYGPGLVGAILTGLLFAKAISFAISKPFIGINHMEGHISSNYLETDFAPPFVCLVVSGGHTELVSVKDYGEYHVLGATRDDAAGEAYDKVARALGLPYPGGPHLDKLASMGNPAAISFPKAYLEDGSYDFSFSGLKSAVVNYLNRCQMLGEKVVREDVAACFQEAVAGVLADKTRAALEFTGAKRAALAGGVASNSEVRRRFIQLCRDMDVQASIPAPVYCTDNAAMIGAAAYYKYLNNDFSKLDLNAKPSLRLGQQ